MRFLFFLLIGTMIFGFKFPAYVMLFALLTVVLFFVMMFNLARKGGAFKIYTNRPFTQYKDFFDRSGSASERYHGETVIDIDTPMQTHEPDIFEEEGEIIELPSSALRKE